MLEEIKTTQEAVELLNEAGGFLNEVEDELDGKVSGEIAGKIETAYLEISEVLGYLKSMKGGQNA